MASPTVAPDVVRPPAGGPAPPGGPAAQVRIEVAMPRGLFDRLTGHDDAPRCRYDEHTGLAEFVAVPDFAHEGQAVAVALFVCRRTVLADPRPPRRGCDVFCRCRWSGSALRTARESVNVHAAPRGSTRERPRESRSRRR